MKTKICCMRKTEKPITEFRLYKSGVNKGHYHSYCKSCEGRANKKHFLNNPWNKNYKAARGRCVYKSNKYYKKGIKFMMSRNDFKILWFRDKAYLMKKPSIDRINPKGDYTLENCRYIELTENNKRRGSHDE